MVQKHLFFFFFCRNNYYPIYFCDQGYAISTDTENGYMYLHLSKYSRVDEIVTLTRQPLKDLTNYFCLYNIHEKYLNNMVQRYEDNLIPDLYNYFREPWACVIFHDRFVDFMDEIREHLEILPIKVSHKSNTITVEPLYSNHQDLHIN